MTFKEFEKQEWKRGMRCLYNGNVGQISGIDFLYQKIFVRWYKENLGVWNKLWVDYEDVEIIKVVGNE
jgi:hypothetical protein